MPEVKTVDTSYSALSVAGISPGKSVAAGKADGVGDRPSEVRTISGRNSQSPAKILGIESGSPEVFKPQGFIGFSPGGGRSGVNVARGAGARKNGKSAAVPPGENFCPSRCFPGLLSTTRRDKLTSADGGSTR